MLPFPSKSTPRWIIFVLDVIYCTFSLWVAYLLRFNFNIPQVESDAFYYVFPFVIATRAISFLLGKTYAGVIRYTSAKDAERIFKVIGLGSLFFLLANQFTFHLINGKFIIPTSVVIIDFITSILILSGARLAAKTLYFQWSKRSMEKTEVIIFGAGEAGIITKRTMDRDAGTRYKIVAFVDDDQAKVNTMLEGVKVYNSARLAALLEEHNISILILTPQKLSTKRKSEITDVCLEHGVKVLSVPPVNRWIGGQLSFKQIKEVKIEDLLGRAEIQLDRASIRSKLRHKTILVTGAAGSIGSELVRQIRNYEPKKIILLDQAESPLYELEVELQEKFGFKDFEVALCDVCNRERLRKVFHAFDVDVVYHAAAYKHVPMIENNPAEAINVNVLGTKYVADLALEYEVQEFVMISTDKAVNPTNVMGASKRIAEIYTQALNERGKTLFVTTRFGNVLGSNGSVIPFFKKQIEKGGPVTVTHPEVTRYFMTIPEASQLVLEASAMGKGGEVFVFDMGESVKIDDLAKKMIMLSGLELDKDIKITYTGLRPGEKLYEELLTEKENTTPTHHPQIMIGKVQEYPFEKIAAEVDELSALIETQENLSIVRKMKEIVPEFKSNNSEYEVLDKEISK